jgi:phosphate-selective porin OprO and OprP
MKLTTALVLTTLGLSTALQAGEVLSASSDKSPEAAIQPREENLYDKIWGLTTFDFPGNSFIQQFSITGRSQFDWFYFDGDQGQEDDWVVRRLRIGARAKILQDFTLTVEADLNAQDPDPLYTRLTYASISWSPSKEFKLTVGKQGAKFTLDGHTSSTHLLTIDRSAIANNFWFPEEYAPGVSISGEVGHWLYNVGYFSSGEASPEFGNFNAGSFGLLSLGYNFAKALHVDKAILRADYVYNDPNELNTFTRPNEQVASINFLYENGPWGLGTDLVAAQGYGSQSDLFGLQIMPSYEITEKLQGVLRYTYVNSDGDNGIRLGRYENRVTLGNGDDYNEFYAGLNYYLYGHKLKLQAGVQYTIMEDAANDGGAFEGWGVTTGLRISW